MRLCSDNELRERGVSEDLIKLRHEFNQRIDDGFNMFNGMKIIRAFISNPNGYNKVFLRGENNGVFELGISPELLTKE